jgi:quercetin dioxygenase-like cupin family protein
MTETTEIQRRSLLAAVLGAQVTVERVEIQQIELPPGQTVGLHRHPCPVVGYVAAGSIDYQIEGKSVQRLQAGDAFFEPANARVARFDNTSPSAARFIAFYLLANGQQQLIEMIKHPEGKG